MKNRLVENRLAIKNQQSCKGYSLVELSVVLVILGVVLLLGIQLVPPLTASADQRTFQQQVSIANQVIEGFALVQGRLPCPDSNGDGLENCAVDNTGGLLPFRTLMLSAPIRDHSHTVLRYAVYQATSTVIYNDPALLQIANWIPGDANLTKSAQRYVPLLPTNDANNALILPSPFQNNNTLDLCVALKQASAAASNATYVHADDGTSISNVAYALASSGLSDSDGDGRLFDGRNALGNNIFDTPDRRISPSYDDHVFAMDIATLQGNLFCSQSLTAMHAQSNVAIASLRSVVALQDAKTNADVAVKNATADVAAAIAANLMAAAGVASSTAEVSTATAEALTTLGGLSASIVIAVAGAALSAVSVVSAVAVSVLTVVITVDAFTSQSGAQTLLDQSKTLATTTLEHVSLADQAGVYGW